MDIFALLLGCGTLLGRVGVGAMDGWTPDSCFPFCAQGQMRQFMCRSVGPSSTGLSPAGKVLERLEAPSLKRTEALSFASH